MSGSYITRRIIDACLRENVLGLLNGSRLCDALPEAGRQVALDCDWLQLRVGDQDVLLPVLATDYMQMWLSADDCWLERETTGAWAPRHGFAHWLELLSRAADESTRAAIEEYQLEAKTAARHSVLCRQAYTQLEQELGRKVIEVDAWHDRLLLAEQIAAFHDHPYYPTARAKSGLSDDALRSYGPEYCQRFKLRWLAVERNLISQTSPPPPCWPSFSEVGLPEDFAESHQLLPVHPLTWSQLSNQPPAMVMAPQPALDVRPTLSVRTLMLEQAPELHIKVPLTMRTLGNKNLRVIKPTTIYDGHRFAQLLCELERRDPKLRGRYQHCDEQHGAHVGDDKRLSYIVRRYPAAVTGNNSLTLVPVAALASKTPDGRLYLEQLIDTFYAGDLEHWLEDYLRLMFEVHLRLWVVHGIALEANQQNAVLVFSDSGPLTLLMKDNDAARLWSERFCAVNADLADQTSQFLDQRILIDSELPLAQMFITITLQLNVAAVLEAVAERSLATRKALYGAVRQRISETLTELSAEGADTRLADETLLQSDRLYVKYLLSAGSLLSKEQSGAEDINKYYGLSAPNFLRGL